MQRLEGSKSLLTKSFSEDSLLSPSSHPSDTSETTNSQMKKQQYSYSDSGKSFEPPDTEKFEPLLDTMDVKQQEKAKEIRTKQLKEPNLDTGTGNSPPYFEDQDGCESRQIIDILELLPFSKF